MNEKMKTYPVLFDIETERLLDRIGEKDSADLLNCTKSALYNCLTEIPLNAEKVLACYADIELLMEQTQEILYRDDLTEEEQVSLAQFYNELRDIKDKLSQRSLQLQEDIRKDHDRQVLEDTLNGMLEYGLFDKNMEMDQHSCENCENDYDEYEMEM